MSSQTDGASHAPHREFELKFVVSPEHMPRLLKARWLGAAQKSRPRIRRLDSTYFDTRDHKLRKSGLALRVRREGDRYIQCVKARGEGADAAFARREWEADVPEGRPDPRILKDGQGNGLLPVGSPDELEPVFQTRVKRTHRLVASTEGDQVAVDLDVGEIAADGTSQPVSEVELELVTGEPRHVFALARRLVAEVPARLSAGAKADHGYALAEGGRYGWSKAEPLVLGADATVEHALSEMVSNTVAHLRANEACALAASDIEGIHQMRVATRRLRAVLSIYKKMLPADQHGRLAGEIKWLGGEMGPARDSDVFLAETLAPLMQWRPDDSGLMRLRERAIERQGQGYERAHKAILSRRYTDLLLDLGAWVEGREWRRGDAPPGDDGLAFDDPATALARRVLSKRHRRVLKDGRHFKRLSSTERHILRIEVKKLRYAAEFLGSLYPGGQARPFASRLSDLQDGLGLLNDIVVAGDYLTDLVRTARSNEVADLHFAAGLVIGWHANAAEEHANDLLKAWKRFAATPAFWTA